MIVTPLRWRKERRRGEWQGEEDVMNTSTKTQQRALIDRKRDRRMDGNGRMGTRDARTQNTHYARTTNDTCFVIFWLLFSFL